MKATRVSLKLIGLVLVLALVCGALCGCGQTKQAPVDPGKPADLPVASNPPAPTPSAPAPSAPAGPGSQGGQAPTEGPDAVTGATVSVHNAQELFEAIKPGAVIVLEPGDYDLTQWIDYVDSGDGLGPWNLSHDYVKITEVFDGFEIWVCYTDDLTIYGKNNNTEDVQITVDPRYAAVLNFMQCKNVTLEHFTAGHVYGSECAGSVLYYENCNDVVMKDLDLYGCGIYGFEAIECNNITTESCTLRECSYGALALSACTGALEFKDCQFVDNQSGLSIYGCEEADISFSNCFFGPWESSILFYDGIHFDNDCEFSDYPGEYPDIDPDNWEGGYPDIEPDSDN